MYYVAEDMLSDIFCWSWHANQLAPSHTVPQEVTVWSPWSPESSLQAKSAYTTTSCSSFKRFSPFLIFLQLFFNKGYLAFSVQTYAFNSCSCLYSLITTILLKLPNFLFASFSSLSLCSLLANTDCGFSTCLFSFCSSSAAPYPCSFPLSLPRIAFVHPRVAWTVSSPADPADVYGADAAGRHHGAEVPIQLSRDSRGGQHPAGSDITRHHHRHRQPPLRC